MGERRCEPMGDTSEKAFMAAFARAYDGALAAFAARSRVAWVNSTAAAGRRPLGAPRNASQQLR
jgi:hypothetical protein